MNIGIHLLLLLLTIPQDNRSTHVDYGKSECAYCRMIIDKKQFGGEVETTDGRILVFDAIECLAASYYREWNIPAHDITSIRLVNYSKPGTLIDASTATLIRTSRVESPMGVNIIAMSSRSAAKQMKSTDDAMMSWKECIEFVKDYWRLPAPRKSQ